jgi:hypothetical protein
MHLLRNVNHCVLALLFALIPARLTLAQTTSCTDEKAFQFVTTNSDETVNCAWLNKNTNNSAKRKSMYCDDPSIKDACSASCGACGRAGTCEDTNGFMFDLDNGKRKGCDWLTKNNTARRTGEYCVESGDFFDPEIADGCVASCGLCEDEDDAPSSTAAPVTSAPASSPTSGSCQDTNGFLFKLNKGNIVECDWFTKRNTARRTGEYCVESGSFFDPEIADGCVASCGLCGELTTSPTQGLTAAPVTTPKRTPSPTQRLTAAPVNTPKRTPSPTQGATAAPVSTPKRTPSPTQGLTAAPVTTPKRTPSPTQRLTAAPVSTPKRTPSPTQGLTAAPVTTPKRTPSPTQGLTAAPTTICPDGASPFTITLMNMGNNTNFDAAFASAKARWESIIKCDLQDIASQSSESDFDWFNGQFSEPFNGAVDDVVIGFSIQPIDGVNGVLGFAGAQYLRGQTDGSSPISGIMVFDQEDFARISPSESATKILY